MTIQPYTWIRIEKGVTFKQIKKQYFKDSKVPSAFNTALCVANNSNHFCACYVYHGEHFYQWYTPAEKMHTNCLGMACNDVITIRPEPPQDLGEL